jgi:hypothetical protein
LIYKSCVFRPEEGGEERQGEDYCDPPIELMSLGDSFQCSHSTPNIDRYDAMKRAQPYIQYQSKVGTHLLIYRFFFIWTIFHIVE